MKTFLGCNVPIAPEKEWIWMLDTRAGAVCQIPTRNLVRECRKNKCTDCIYSSLNRAYRACYYKQTFKGGNMERPELKDGMTCVIEKDENIRYCICLAGVLCEVEDDIDNDWEVEAWMLTNDRTIPEYCDVLAVWDNVVNSTAGMLDKRFDVMWRWYNKKVEHNDPEPIWIKPEEVKEVTMAEVEKQFGCKVKIKREE